MGAFSRFERRLGGAVEGGFARVFRSRVEPVELAQALKREADENRTVGPSRTLVPNRYEVDLGPSDYDRLAPYRLTLGDELAEMIREHASEQRYATVGEVEVSLVRADDLRTGAYRIGSRVEAEAGPAEPLYQPPPAAYDPPRRAAYDEPYREPYIPPLADLTPPRPTVPPVAMTTALPHPEPPRTYGRLELPDGGTVIVGERPLLLGRGHEADVRLTDSSVSRSHARVLIEHDLVVVEDLGSTNGTSVEGQRVMRAELRDGDRLTLGAAIIVFRA